MPARVVPRFAATGGRNDAAVLMALVRLGRNCSYAPIIEATGLNSSAIKMSLDRLRAAGLVTWEPDLNGTIRAVVGEVYAAT